MITKIEQFKAMYEQYASKVTADTYAVYRGEGGGGEGGSWNGSGIYFSDNKNEASLYGEVKKYIIRMSKPFDIVSVNDTSVQGSGLIKLFANTEGLNDVKYNGKTFSELNTIITKLEIDVDANKIETGSANGHFKHVYYEHNGKEYTIHNRTVHEYENLNYMKELFIKHILDEEYGIDRLPVRIMEAINPTSFSNILKKLGYDGVIANNSLLSGHEYVIFDKSQIIERDVNELRLWRPDGVITHGKQVDDDQYTYTATSGERTVSTVVMEDMVDGYWELSGVLSTKQYADLIKSDGVFKLIGMDTADDNRKQGMATDLLKYALENIKKIGAVQVYLFVKPTGASGPDVNRLEIFYNKFGFKSIADTKDGKLMLLNLQ